MNTSGAAWWDTRRKVCAKTGLQETALASRLDCAYCDSTALQAKASVCKLTRDSFSIRPRCA
jgi:hypothetical protein